MRTETIHIPEQHPVFAGHFPDRPVVPGSMLLELITAAWGGAITRVSTIKFLRPVLPGDILTLHFALAGAGPAIHFSATRAGETVCAGVIIPEPP